MSLTSVFASRNERGWADGHSPQKAAHEQPRVSTLWAAGVAKRQGRKGNWHPVIQSVVWKHGSTWVLIRNTVSWNL